MALLQSLRSVQRSIAPFATSRLLVAVPRQFGSTVTVKSAEPVQQDLPDAEVSGWGSTTVGEVLKAKMEDSGAWLWCAKDDWVIDAVRKMTHANVGSLLVFDPSKVAAPLKPTDTSSDAVVGIITERDYLTKVVVKGKNSSNTKVADIMTPSEKLVTVTPRHSVLDVMTLMVERNFRHVPVIGEGNAMAGMVSIRDVVYVMLKEHREEVGRLQEYIQGTF